MLTVMTHRSADQQSSYQNRNQTANVCPLHGLGRKLHVGTVWKHSPFSEHHTCPLSSTLQRMGKRKLETFQLLLIQLKYHFLKPQAAAAFWLEISVGGACTRRNHYTQNFHYCHYSKADQPGCFHCKLQGAINTQWVKIFP